MPTGKSRNYKRQSSSSYTSSITTIVFIALCVLGVWMLTSNSIAPPQTTTRTATDRDIAYSSSNEQQTSKRNDKKDDPPVYEDNPGDLPDDAIKSDDNKPDVNSKDDDKPQEDQKADNSKDSEGNINGGDGKDNEDKVKEEGSVVEENPQGLQGKESAEEQEKQTENETQVTEESAVTQNQQAEQTTNQSSETEQIKEEESSTENQVSEEGKSQDQSSGSESRESSRESQNVKADENQKQQEGEIREISQDTQNQVSDEEQQKRIQQQLREDEGLDNTQETQKQSSNENQQQQQEHNVESSETENTKETQNQISEEDQQQRLQEQKQEQKKQKGKSDETKKQQQEQSSPQEFPDVTTDPAQKNEGEQTEKILETKQGTNTVAQATDSNSGESFPAAENSGIPKESKESKKSWKTQATQSEIEKERRKDKSDGGEAMNGYTWHLCNVTAGTDYIPCLDNEKALKQLHTTKHFEHRERHCPEEGPTCLVPLPEGYKISIEWPGSRDKIWYHNVPHTKLAEVKGHQNWVKVTGEFLTFPGGGTQFIHGALHYIDFLQQSVTDIAWGKHTRVILDVGCGVASFGGYLFERDAITVSFAPKDEHEAQVQFALERGIPAISAVMGSQRLPFPARVFDTVHCARCRVPWHAEGGTLLLELNRVLRPGGYFIWSATPVYQKLEEDVEIWKAMSALTVSMCWELVTIQRDKLNSVGAAIYRKPSTNECYDQRKSKQPPMCKSDDDANAAWYVPLQTCMHRVPVDAAERGTRWPEEWPRRLQTPPYWLNSSQMGIYGKPAPQDFASDYEHWKRVVSKSYMSGLGISWKNVRNVMDMRAVYGGFAAALKDLKVWVMNVVNVDSPDTLPIIYERGLFGIYHDWCESFSTYPRTYDLMHADHLFSKLKNRCKLAPVMAEVDRMIRPGGKLIVRDESSAIGEVESLLKSLHWEVRLTFSKVQEGILSAQKGDWRPNTYAASS